MKTKCAVMRGINKPLEIEYHEVPELKIGQVLVKVLWSGLCGSQLNELCGNKGEDKFLPHLMGHEGYGTVISCGEGITKVKPGDGVVLTWLKGTGLEGGPKKYDECNAGSITTFQEYSIISENRLVKASGDAKKLAMLGCMLPTGFGSVIHFKYGDSIRIFGAGNIGSASILAAKHLSMKVYVVDVSKEKLDYATYLGADVVNLPTDELEKVDLALDTTGNNRVTEQAFDSLKNNGLLVIIGNAVQGSKISIDPFEFIKGKRIVGSWGGNCNPDTDIPQFMNINIDKLDIETYKLDEINTAIGDFKKGICGKVLVEC